MIKDRDGLTLWERRATKATDPLTISYFLARARAEYLDGEIEKIGRNLPWWRLIKRYKRMRLCAEYGQCQLDIGLIGHIIDPNDELL